MSHNAPAPLISESLPPETWDREEIFELIYEGERKLDPVALKSGAFYHPQGAYQVFETPEKARIGIWAPDPDDLAVEDVTLTAAQVANRFRRDLAGNHIPLKEGDVLPGRLKDLGNGNLSRLRIFTIKIGRAHV